MAVQNHLDQLDFSFDCTHISSSSQLRQRLVLNHRQSHIGQPPAEVVINRHHGQQEGPPSAGSRVNPAISTYNKASPTLETRSAPAFEPRQTLRILCEDRRPLNRLDSNSLYTSFSIGTPASRWSPHYHPILPHSSTTSPPNSIAMGTANPTCLAMPTKS